MIMTRVLPRDGTILTKPEVFSNKLQCVCLPTSSTEVHCVKRCMDILI